MLGRLANLRPSFKTFAEADRVPEPVRLSTGTQGPHLVCLATPVAMGGVYQFARLAAHFRGVRSVSAVPMPGFQAGDMLPKDPRAIVAVLVAAIKQAVGDEPYVLLGYSSAGIIAQACAKALEKSGLRPAGVILLDTYPVSRADLRRTLKGERDEALEDMAAGMLEREEDQGAFDRTKLTAMARYMELLPWVRPGAISAPSVLLRPERRLPSALGNATGSGDPDAWRTNWRRADTVRTVSGDHFSIVAEDAESTARAIAEWLDTDRKPKRSGMTKRRNASRRADY
ncbi:MAG: alpha/beta fold hydrolase [Catenulispora sp.]|nr:alpha/beta fold hydrolase [Catenulispora sp.]